MCCITVVNQIQVFGNWVLDQTGNVPPFMVATPNLPSTSSPIWVEVDVALPLKYVEHAAVAEAEQVNMAKVINHLFGEFSNIKFECWTYVAIITLTLFLDVL